MPLTTAIFDLDGLLVDTEPMYWQVYRGLLSPFGKDMTLVDYARHYSGGTRERNLGLLIRQYDLPITMGEIDARQRALVSSMPLGGVPAKPGARELLEWLEGRGVRIALATSSNEPRARRLLDGNGIWAFFGIGAYGHEVSRSKPAPDVFLLAAQRADADPSECVVFEDSESGVRAAAAAGMRVVCVPDMRQPSAEVAGLATAVVESLSDAIPVLEGWL